MGSLSPQGLGITRSPAALARHPNRVGAVTITRWRIGPKGVMLAAPLSIAASGADVPGVWSRM